MVHSLDAQPIDDVFVGGQTTVLVQVDILTTYFGFGVHLLLIHT